MNVKMAELVTVCADMDTKKNKLFTGGRGRGGEEVDSMVNKAGWKKQWSSVTKSTCERHLQKHTSYEIMQFLVKSGEIKLRS